VGVVKYHLLNQSKQTVLASEVELADTSWSRMKGLLGQTSESFTAGKGLWITPSQGVHTIGMKFPIDVVYLDKGHRVIHISHSLPPFRIAAIKLKARSVVELPAGTLAQTRTSIGDVLEISAVQATIGIA
jgi:uncharacterized membrane protein (UPF0127 family)